MHTVTIRHLRLAHFASALAGLFFMTSTSTWATNANRVHAGLSNDEAAFVFAGKCPSDEPYRLVSYQKNVTGSTYSFYDYEGPNGKGTVQSETSPKVMAARVCRKMAEIINANYWE
jgi:hypothetical protein